MFAPGTLLSVLSAWIVVASCGVVNEQLAPFIFNHPFGYLYLPHPPLQTTVASDIWSRIQHGIFHSPNHYPSTSVDSYGEPTLQENGDANEIEGRTPARLKPNPGYIANSLFHPFERNHFLYPPGVGTESRLVPSFRNPLPNFGNSFGTRFSTLASGLSWFDGSTCVSPNAEAGICASSRACANSGGRSSGSCGSFGTVCCINIVNRCGATVTLNNTYWQAPITVSAESTCTLSIQLDPSLPEQRRNPICQVRLDFEAFSIAQPNTQTVCQTDNFRVSGTSNKVPIICGQNVGQHMYLIAPSSTADLQLIFTLGVGTSIDRNWRIRIGLLECSATKILAPADCLQYFTQSSGTVRSFNWREASPTATAPRQLANQDYNICFRTEQISTSNAFSRVSSSICFATCVITTVAVAPLTTPLAFSLTGDSTSAFLAAGSGAGPNPPQCANTDYIVINGAVDPSIAANFNDRFCANQLNPQTAPVSTASVTVCSTVKPYNIYYRTDGSEAATEFANNGFCLRFEQRA